jgi:phosphohistidine swiveling domain-containing protein
MTITNLTTSSTHPQRDLELPADGAYGPHPVWGDALVWTREVPRLTLPPGSVLVVDDLVPDLLPFLPGCVGVIVESPGPWESVLGGTLHDDFSRSGAAALLRVLGVPHAWGVEGATTHLHTGDLVQLDAEAATVWVLPLP